MRLQKIAVVDFPAWQYMSGKLGSRCAGAVAGLATVCWISARWGEAITPAASAVSVTVPGEEGAVASDAFEVGAIFIRFTDAASPKDSPTGGKT